MKSLRVEGPLGSAVHTMRRINQTIWEGFV